MATKADFTQEEWETMQKGVTGAGMLVALADRGFFDSFKEASALAKHLKQAHEGNESVLVRELADTRHTGFGMTSSNTEVETETIEALGSSVATLEQKAPDELPAYRAFVLAVARSVADAAGDGDEAESGAMAKIEGALG